MTHRKRRLREEASHHHVKRLNRGFKLGSKKRDYKKPEYFINQYRRAERDTNRIKRCIFNNKLFAPPKNVEQKLLVVTHHRAHKISSEECKKVLGSLKLGQLHSTVLLPNDTETCALLKLVEPYVIYGYPSIKTVRDLVFKHGYLKINGKKTAISSNKMIEEHLGTRGIICIEDIVHELFTVSENFDFVKKYLLPFRVSISIKLSLMLNFSILCADNIQVQCSIYSDIHLILVFKYFTYLYLQLKAPRDGWSSKIGVSYERGGEYGNRKHEIDVLIEKCI